jgi:hypothetical protein
MSAWPYIPDIGTAGSDIQSIEFSIDYEVVSAASARVDGRLSGCVPSQQVAPDMTVACSSGEVVSNSSVLTVAGGNWTVGTADATNPRIDLLVVTSAGSLAVRAGTAAAAPKPPARAANDVVCGHVFVGAGVTSIIDDNITRAKMADVSSNQLSPLSIDDSVPALPVLGAPSGVGISISAGDDDGGGAGEIYITGGSDSVNVGGAGGVYITSGADVGGGGAARVEITGGADSANAGGAGGVYITGGADVGGGGAAGVFITGGADSANAGGAGRVEITGGADVGGGGGGAVLITGGEDSSGGGNAGDVTVKGGAHTTGGGAAGNAIVSGGDDVSGSTGGGDATLKGGDDTGGGGGGGIASVLGGNSGNNPGGPVFITGGNAAAGNNNGGDVNLNGGAGFGTGAVGNIVLSGSLDTTATGGFVQLPACAGPPTGTVASPGNGVSVVFDTTNNKLYAYIGSAWKSVTLS